MYSELNSQLDSVKKEMLPIIKDLIYEVSPHISEDILKSLTESTLVDILTYVEDELLELNELNQSRIKEITYELEDSNQQLLSYIDKEAELRDEVTNLISQVDDLQLEVEELNLIIES